MMSIAITARIMIIGIIRRNKVQSARTDPKITYRVLDPIPVSTTALIVESTGMQIFP